MPKRTLSLAALAAAAGFSASFLLGAPAPTESFQPTIPGRHPRDLIAKTALRAVADPPSKPPGYHEDEKKRKFDYDGEDGGVDWTARDGGFIPNIAAVEKRRVRRKRKGTDVVMTVENINDYKIHVADEAERITVVRFSAPWCRSCKASRPLFRKMAGEYSENHGVKFVEVPLTKDNAYLHQGLGVPSLPWAHIYHPEGGLVEERKMSKKHIGKVRRSLQWYVDGSCDLADEPTEFASDEGQEDTDRDEEMPIGEFQ